MIRVLIILMAFAFWPLFLIVKAIRRRAREAATRRAQNRAAAHRRRMRLSRYDPFSDLDFMRRMYGYPYGYPYFHYRSPSTDYMMWLPIWILWIVVIFQLLDNK